MSDAVPLLKGTLDLLVVKALNWQAMHGYEITAWLEKGSRGRLEIEDSALYQALYRMEARGLIQAEWGVTENNRRARYYRATTAGRAFLRTETARWLRYSDAVTGVLRLASKP